MSAKATVSDIADLIRRHVRLEWRGHDDADINPRSVTAAAEAICASMSAAEAALPPDDSTLVTGLPMLVLSGGRQWHVLGENGARFHLALVQAAPAAVEAGK